MYSWMRASRALDIPTDSAFASGTSAFSAAISVVMTSAPTPIAAAVKVRVRDGELVMQPPCSGHSKARPFQGKRPIHDNGHEDTSRHTGSTPFIGYGGSSRGREL